MLLILLLIVTAAFAIAGFVGAPYVPILGRDSRPLLKLTHLKPGQTLIDLGSGDGRLLHAAAAQGVRCIGYEINPFMVWVSRLVCWRYRHLVTIHLANFWHVQLPPADIIYVFLLPRLMDRLDRKLSAEITRPTKVISYAFEFPARQPSSRPAHAFVYDFGQD